MSYDRQLYEKVPKPGLYRANQDFVPDSTPDLTHCFAGFEIFAGEVFLVLEPMFPGMNYFHRILTAQGIYDCHVFWINRDSKLLT